MLFSFIWLFYLAFPIASLVNLPPGQMAGGFALLVVFVAAYLYSFRYRSHRLTGILIMLAIIGIFSFWLGENFLFMAFFASPIMAFLPSKKKMGTAIAVLTLLFLLVGAHFHLQDDMNQMLQLMPVMLIALFMPIALRMGQKSKQLRLELILANEEIARLSKQEERQRISRDLHDTLGHTLSLISLKSELAEKLIGKHPERAIQEVKDIHTTSRAALRQVRELVTGMNTVTIRDELIHAKQLAAAAGIEVEVLGAVSEQALSPLADNLIGMCLRESVTNAIKYSKARTITIVCKEETSRLTLSVADDGQGFDPALARMSTGSGLRGMKERLQLLDGTVELAAAVGRGAKVTFSIPRVASSVRT